MRESNARDTLNQWGFPSTLGTDDCNLRKVNIDLHPSQSFRRKVRLGLKWLDTYQVLCKRLTRSSIWCLPCDFSGWASLTLASCSSESLSVVGEGCEEKAWVELEKVWSRYEEPFISAMQQSLQGAGCGLLWDQPTEVCFEMVCIGHCTREVGIFIGHVLVISNNHWENWRDHFSAKSCWLEWFNIEKIRMHMVLSSV